MRFGTWSASSLYRLGSFRTAAREAASYKLYIVGVQEVLVAHRGNVRKRGNETPGSIECGEFLD
jgi:hypothetical protein